jgi:hypothetical protein
VRTWFQAFAFSNSKLCRYAVAPGARVTDHRTAITGITAETLVGAPSLGEVRARVLRILNGGGVSGDGDVSSGGGGGVHEGDEEGGGGGVGRGGGGGGGGGLGVGDGGGGGGGGGDDGGGDDDGGKKVLLVGHDLPHDLDCLAIRHPQALCRDTAHYPLFQRHTHHPYKLRQLAATLLHATIQAEGSAHDPREDAVAAMRLYLGGRALCDAHHPGGVSGENVLGEDGGGEDGGGAQGLLTRGGVGGGGVVSPPPRATGGASVSTSASARSPLRETSSPFAAGGGTWKQRGRGPLGRCQSGAAGQQQQRERVVEPRFVCWCVDLGAPAPAAAAAAWALLPPQVRAKSTTTTTTTAAAHGGASPSPLKVLKDATNTNVYSSPGSSKKSVWVGGGAN